MSLDDGSYHKSKRRLKGQNLKQSIIITLILLTHTCYSIETLIFKINPNIHNNKNIQFISNKAKGAFGTYLTMNINYSPMRELFSSFTKSEPNIKLKSRGEAHITVITPIEYNKVLKNKITIKEIEQIALKNKIQSSKFEITCLGRGQKIIDNKNEQTYFIVVKSKNLLDIRTEIQELFISKGGNPKDFKANNYYPHITVGFTKRDLHENDGIIKGKNSCYKEII